MSFLKQILTPFVEFEEDKNPAPLKKQEPQVPAPADKDITHPLINDASQIAPVPPIAAPSTTPNPVSDTIPFPEHEVYFDNLIEKANRENPVFAGPDFKEFADTIADIDDITDETLKYTTAFNMLKAAGLKKDRLMQAAHEYMNLIGRDLNAYQTAHARKYKVELQQKELALQKKAEELQALTMRLNVLKAEVNSMSTEITSKRDELNKVRQSFLLAGENKQKEIQNEVEKISRYF
ncbi:MAG TPA: hypothetical protein VGB63_06210 [Pedobacter sp.]|jgi:hypothetical protein